MEYVCDNCNNVTAIENIGLMSCQSSSCICNQCYDYKCKTCNFCTLDNSVTYLDDGEPKNICGNCQLYATNIEFDRI